ncbi:hypothetical protein SprV_0602159000 [Sparganum proliferum]
MLSVMLMDACSDKRSGVRIAYRTDGHRRMHFRSRASTTSVHKLLFVDDCALGATSEGDGQRSMDLFVASCDNFGLAINTENTVVKHQPSHDTAYVAPRINVNNARLYAVDNFISLGSTLSHNTKIDDEVARGFPRSSKPSVVCEIQFGIDTLSQSAPN